MSTVPYDFTPDYTLTGALTGADFPVLTAKYRLVGDVTLAATIPGTFQGVLDGNGYLATVDAPFFANAEEAVFMNLRIDANSIAPSGQFVAFGVPSTAQILKS